MTDLHPVFRENRRGSCCYSFAWLPRKMRSRWFVAHALAVLILNAVGAFIFLKHRTP
jgi:hypothetical protein